MYIRFKNYWKLGNSKLVKLCREQASYVLRYLTGKWWKIFLWLIKRGKNFIDVKHMLIWTYFKYIFILESVNLIQLKIVVRKLVVYIEFIGFFLCISIYSVSRVIGNISKVLMQNNYINKSKWCVLNANIWTIFMPTYFDCNISNVKVFAVWVKVVKKIQIYSKLSKMWLAMHSRTF